MERKDIKTLIKVLNYQKRPDLAKLLENSESEIEESEQFGSQWNSALSTFIIFAPLEQYYKLKELLEGDYEIILKSILEIYPVRAEAPEITAVEFRILQDEEETENEQGTYIGKTIRIFVSYSTEDKVLAGLIKTNLEYFGFEVFLAHEDINPSSEWQEAIKENLESTDIFIPIITKTFSNSYWTDQETGMALSKDKLIIPVSIEGNVPYGFIGKIQALKLNINSIELSCKEIIRTIIREKPKFISSLLDSLIKVFGESMTYDDAGIRARFLLEFEPIAKDQINEIFNFSVTNGQIYGSRNARPSIEELFSKYKHLIDDKLLEEVEKNYGFTSGQQEVTSEQEIPF